MWLIVFLVAVPLAIVSIVLAGVRVYATSAAIGAVTTALFAIGYCWGVAKSALPSPPLARRTRAFR
jgi:hypothetical protein